MENCGIDLHQKHRQICILDEAGEALGQTRISTSRSALARIRRMRILM